jgi:hypothetical protein
VLVGVIFFLYRLKDVLLYVSLFTIGHSTTLLLGVLGNIHANAYIIDAIIGLSVAYKAFENMGGFDRLGFHPNTRAAVTVFGLFHGFGLATKLQEFTISPNGLVTNIVSFNVGVEIDVIDDKTKVTRNMLFFLDRKVRIRNGSTRLQRRSQGRPAGEVHRRANAPGRARRPRPLDRVRHPARCRFVMASPAASTALRPSRGRDRRGQLIATTTLQTSIAIATGSQTIRSHRLGVIAFSTTAMAL